MRGSMEVPDVTDLGLMPLEVAHIGTGVTSVTAWADDGAGVSMTWDEMACSVQIRWTDDGGVRFNVERESISKISIRDENGRIEFAAWSEAEGMVGRLIVLIGKRVNISDALLRR